jgi:Fibronectin type III domain
MINFSFRQFNDPKLFMFSNVIIQRLKNDPQFTSFQPQLEALTTACAAFTVILADPQARRMAKDARRDDLLAVLNLLAPVVEVFAKGDVAIEEASGFDTRKNTISKITSVDAPTNFSVLNTERSGEVRLSWKTADGALNYTAEYRLKDQTVWQSGNFTTKRELLLSGFEPGTYLEFRVRTLGRGELKSDWTPVVGVWVA